MKNINYRIFHFATPKTAIEALEWLESNTTNFRRLRGSVELDKGAITNVCPMPATTLDYLYGIDWDGRKIRTGSRRDAERIALANEKIEYYAIIQYDRGDIIEVRHNFYSAAGFAKYNVHYVDNAASYEMFEI
jgi:hypothetical protein